MNTQCNKSKVTVTSPIANLVCRSEERIRRIVDLNRRGNLILASPMLKRRRSGNDIINRPDFERANLFS
jgi:hypothetical protein